MELELNVLSSLSIQRKKPWSRFSWLEEPEPPHGLYLFSEGGRMSQLSLTSGKTKRKFPTLSSIQNRVGLTVSTPSGSHLGGLLLEGDLFVWDKSNDQLTIFVTPLSKMGHGKMDASALKGTRFFLSDSGELGLLVSKKMELYLWECKEGHSVWWRLLPPQGVQLPSPADRESTVDSVFHTNTTLGECCTCVFASTDHSSSQTVLTTLLINWPSPAFQLYSHLTNTQPYSSELITSPFVNTQEREIETDIAIDQNTAVSVQNHQSDHHTEHSGRILSIPLQDVTNVSSTVKFLEDPSHTYFDQLSSQDHVPPFETSWRTITRHPITPLTGRGSYVLRLSPSCSLGALAVNYPQATDTEMLFFSPLANAELSVRVFPKNIEGLTGRTFWLADMAWTADGLLLVCMSKRGSLLILPRCGPPLRLFARGCSIEMGPCQFLPLHPLVTVVGVSRKVTGHETSESSERDTLRQRFSVATHPNLPIILCSDGYSLTVLKLPTLSLPSLLSTIVCNVRKMLGLQSIAPLTSSVFSHSDPTKQTESIDLLNVAANFSESTGLGDTLANSVDTSAIGGYMPALSGVDIGGIHFAGLGSTLEFPAPVGNHFEDAVTNLLCAWGLVLTCCPTVVTNDSSSLQSSQNDMTNATMLLIRSILDVLQIQDDRQNDAVIFINVLFSLLPFDSIAQSHLSTVATLANEILVARLTRFYNTFLPLKQGNKMIDYINSMNNNISEISDLLDSLTAIIENTYSLRPVNDGSNCFYSPNFLGKRSRNYLSSAISALAPACFWLLKVSQRFHQDVNTCEQIVKKQITSAVGESRNQATEMSVLYNKLSECLNSALVTIQYVNTQIRWISSTQMQIGNPITSNFPKKQRKVSILISKLEQYDIQGALQYVHSLINYSEAVESELVPFKLSKRFKPVILVLCKVMTSFFCEEAQFILIPSHTPHEAILSRTKLSEAVQKDPVAKFWTLDHTLELLIMSQFWIEACSFLQQVGDWKKAFLLATVIVRHSRLMGLEYAELNILSHQLAVENVLQIIGFQLKFPTAATTKLRLSRLPGTNDSHLQQTAIISFVSDCLRVCACAKLDGLLLTLVSSLVSEMTHCCKELPLEVPSAIYLPAPPLFCPQPAVPNEDFLQCPLEYRLRGKLSTLIRSLVFILTSSHTLLPCARWYSSQLEQLHSSGPSLHPPGYSSCKLPQGLAELAQDNGQPQFSIEDGGTVKVLLSAFRELCGLLWFLHVRDQLSKYLRVLQPSPLKERAPATIVQKASLWSARLLQFTSLLENMSSSSHNLAEGAALTIFSELEANTFLADILAYCFPAGNDTQTTDGKLDRLISHLRSVQGQNSIPLSVHYVTKSQETFSQREKLGASQGKFCELVLMEDSNYLVENDALGVGSFLFEYDSDYIKLIDSVLSVILPEKARGSLSQLHQSSNLTDNKSNTPLLSQFLGSVRKDYSCWEQVLPLIEYLHTWTSFAGSLTTSSHDKMKSKSKKKLQNKSSRKAIASLKVNISPKLVINSIKQREEEHLRKSRGSSFIKAHDYNSKTVAKEEMNISSNSLVEEGFSVQKTDETDGITILPDTSVSGPPQLIQLPLGTLKGRISGDQLVNKLSSISQLGDLTTNSLDTEQNSSISLGELPSAITYSVGEKKSKAVTETDDNNLGDTLAEISENVTLTFNDFILPTSGTTSKSTPNTPPSKSSAKEVQHASGLQENTMRSPSEENGVVKNVERTIEFPDNEDLDNNGSSDDSGSETFTVTPSTITVSQSVHSLEINNSTLLTQEDHTPELQTQIQGNIPGKDPCMHQGTTAQQNISVDQKTESTNVSGIVSRGLDEQTIVTAVKTEIRDILQLRQQRLLSMLNAMETKKEVSTSECGTQIDFQDKPFVAQDKVSAISYEQSQDALKALHQPVENTMPMLNLEDLQSPSETSYSNPPPSANISSLQNKFSRDQYVQTCDDFVSGSKVALSDLTTCKKDSPGGVSALPQFTSTTMGLQQQRQHAEHPIVSTPKPSKEHIPPPVIGQFSRIAQTKSGADLSLLQLGPYPSVSDSQKDSKLHLQKIEMVYPDFAQNVNSIVPPPPLSSVSSTGVRPSFLKMADLNQQQSSSQAPKTLTNRLIQRPLLLTLPLQQTVPQPSYPHHPPPVFPFFPNNRHPQIPSSLPPRSSHSPNRLPTFAAKYSPAHSRPLLLSLPPQPPNRNPHPVYSKPTPPQVTNTLPYTLPNVPLVPFVPTLLPQPFIQANPAKVPPLLQANDPINVTRQTGLKLLQIPSTEHPKLISLPTKVDKQNPKPRVKENGDLENLLLHNPPEFRQSDIPSSTSVSDTGLYQKRKSTFRKRPKKRKQKVAWEEIEEPVTQKLAHYEHKPLDTEPHIEDEEHFLKTPGQKESLPKSQAQSIPSTGKQREKYEPRRPSLVKLQERSYPVDIPLESLQMRRLNLKSQLGHTLPTSSTGTNVSELSDTSVDVSERSSIRTDITITLSPCQQLPSDPNSPESTILIHKVELQRVDKTTKPCYPKSSNEVYCPPVLALNVTDQDSLSISTVSLSSTVTLTPIKHTTESQKEPMEIAETHNQPCLNHVGHQITTTKENLDPLLTANKVCVETHSNWLGAHTQPDSVTSAALQRLQELEEQLDAIENTAKTVEGEFKSSKQILHTIDKLQDVVDPMSDAESAPDSESRSTPDMFPSITTQLADLHRTEAVKDDAVVEALQQKKLVRFQRQPISTIKLKDPERENKNPPKAINKRLGNWKREELRQWMMVKRKERLAEFREQRETHLKSEKRPFKPGGTKLPIERQKRDKKQEFLAKRIDDAFELMQDMLTTKPSLSPKSTSTANSLTRKKYSADKRLKNEPSSIMYSSSSTRDRKNRTENGPDTPLGTFIKNLHEGTVPGTSTPKRLSNSSARKLSSIEGLTEKEQMQIADVLASTVYDGSSVSSGSVLTDIDWEEVDKILKS